MERSSREGGKLKLVGMALLRLVIGLMMLSDTARKLFCELMLYVALELMEKVGQFWERVGMS